jgi:NAD(P)-dependent dehydrogenase (short-subunit alcohol dehydrogenase family)
MDSSTKKAAWVLGTALAASVLARQTLRHLRRFDWKGKRVLITGGSRGLGLVIARRLVSQGALVAFCSRTRTDVDSAARELSEIAIATNTQVLGDVCDVSEEAQVAKFVSRVKREFGGIDVLINCAGVMTVGPWESMTPKDFQESMDSNCWGILNTVRAVEPIMRRQGWGRILNVVSMGGQRAVPHMLPYDTSKFAAFGLSTGLRAELAKSNILVVTVCPTVMRTGSPRNAKFKGQHRKEFAWFSISASLPFVSLDADDAAKKVIRACENGDPIVEIAGTLNPLGAVSRILPGWTIEALAIVNRLMPRMGGIGNHEAKGYESQSKLSPSFLTRLGDNAAIENNEVSS